MFYFTHNKKKMRKLPIRNFFKFFAFVFASCLPRTKRGALDTPSTTNGRWRKQLGGSMG